MTAILSFTRNCWVNALLLLVSCQDTGHKFGCETVHAQFFHQNPLACPITNSHLFSYVGNGLTSSLTDELLNSCNNFRSCAACGSPCVFFSQDWHKIWVTLAVPFCGPLWKPPQVMQKTPNKCVWKLPMSTQLRATWHTDSLYMVVLPSTGSLGYHNCCIDGGTSLEYFGYDLVLMFVGLTKSLI
jgi:hypothetical protein